MKITVLEPLGISDNDMQILTRPFIENGDEVLIYKDRAKDENVLIERVAGSDVIVIANMPLSEEVINSDASLKMISVAFTGVDHVGMQACREKRVVVCNAAGYSTNSVAELTFGLMISVLRNIVPLDREVRDGGTKTGYSQHELYGKTIGIVGTGSIGMKVANIAQAFECNVLAYSRSIKKEALEMGIKYVPLNELMKESDIVTVHTPLSEETRGLIGRDEILLMKNSAILINTARGPIVDYNALSDALKNGTISGAGIDVFENEPPLSKDHPLIGAPNVTVTPHIGFASSEAIMRRAIITFDNISKWIDKKPQNIMK